MLHNLLMSVIALFRSFCLLPIGSLTLNTGFNLNPVHFRLHVPGKHSLAPASRD